MLTMLPQTAYPPDYRSGVLTKLGGKIHLGVGFALICFQRLSDPDLATRRLHLAA